MNGGRQASFAGMILLALLSSGCEGRAPTAPAAAVPSSLGKPSFELDYGRLSASLDQVEQADRNAVQDAVRLIRERQHTLALIRLSSLNQSHPENSSLRILTSFALLQAGNLVGAFEEAEKAHAAPNGNSYKCWFLSKVAALNGNPAICEREMRHVRHAGDMAAEADELEKEFQRRFGSQTDRP